MEKLILIKLGGSLITDKNKAAIVREKVIKRLAKEIASARKRLKTKIVLGHGSGSFGHSLASKYGTQKGLTNNKSVKGASAVSDTAIALNRIVVKNFLNEELPVISFSPASFMISKKGQPQKAFLEPIGQALKAGFIPLVYGDVVMDRGQGVNITSTEKVLNVLAGGLSKKYKIEKIIYCGVTDGVYDKKGKTIAKITSKTFGQFKSAIGSSGSTDITGGMIHKVKEALKAAKKLKVPIFIVNASSPGRLRKILVGGKTLGTLISA